MRDLIFTYKNRNNEVVEKIYLNIFDFTDEVENNNPNAPQLTETNVNAIFFENNMTAKHFETIEDLYQHCKRIMQ